MEFRKHVWFCGKRIEIMERVASYEQLQEEIKRYEEENHEFKELVEQMPASPASNARGNT